jgi:integrase
MDARAIGFQGFIDYAARDGGDGNLRFSCGCDVAYSVHYWGNPAKTGAFRCSTPGVRAVFAANRRDRRRIGAGATATGGTPVVGRRGMAKVFVPDRERLAAKGFEAIAHVPVLFGTDGRYLREHNRYLRERARLEWHPGLGGDVLLDRSLTNMADKLKNFVMWCAARSIDWRTAAYARVLDYQREQIEGRWSLQGVGKLLPSTANDRADEATNFLRWAADRKLRAKFDVKMLPKPGSRDFGMGPSLVRAGRAKEDIVSPQQAGFILPEPEEVREWLVAVRARRGYMKYLACKIVMNTGARRHEVEALTKDQWPTAEAIANVVRRRLLSVPMRITVTKGSRPRTIRVPISLAQEVRQYIDGKRKTYAMRFARANHGRRTDRLLLSDHPEADGNPISAQTIYRCFSEVDPHPEGWAPHKGRHVFACFWVLNALQADAERSGGVHGKSEDWVNNRGDFWLKALQRQFGHVSTATTEEYLRWLVHAISLAELSSGWHRFLDGDGE